MKDIDKDHSIEEKDDLAKTGIVAGSGMVGLGGTAAGLAAMSERILGSKKISLGEKKALLTHLEERARVNGLKTADFLKKAKKVGGITAAVGAPILGISAYKHYKYKKQIKDKEKTGLNNNQQN